MEVNIFDGYQSTQPALISVEQMVSIIKSDTKLANLTRLYRETHDHKYKSQCYCFSVTCVFQGGKAKKDIVKVLPLGLCDVDHVPKNKLESLLNQLKSDKHVWMAYTTVSGEGIRVIYRYEQKPGMTMEEQMKFYPLAFTHGNKYFAQMLGVEYDEHCCNLGRLTGAAYDPNVYYNPNAEPFSADWLMAREQEKKEREKQAAKSLRNVKKIEKIYNDLLSQELQNEGKTYVPGSRNEYVSCLAYKLNAFGFPAESALEFIRQQFPDYERPKSVVDSCYQQTQEHGKRKWHAKRSEKAPSASVGEIIQFLDEHVELRYNEITSRVEYKTDHKWLPINDRKVNTLWREMSNNSRVTAQDFYRVIESDYVKPFHPFKAYLEHLPEWKEGDEDYIQQLAASITIMGSEKQQRLWEKYLQKWLVGMVAGWIMDDVVNNVILVLIGEQGCGKSTWICKLLPPELQQYVYTKTNSSKLSKDDILVLATYAIVLCEELDTMKPSELNQLKAAVTMLSIDERAAYAHFAEHRLHIASFAATGNNTQFLSDPTGNRRWLPFEVKSIRSPREYPFDYPHIYAQALHLLRTGFRYWFTKSEIIELNQHNHQFEAPRLERELVSLYFAVPGEGQNGIFMTASRALQIIGVNIAQKLNAVWIGRAFKELGFQKVRMNHCWGYLVMERTAEEIKAMQHRWGREANDKPL